MTKYATYLFEMTENRTECIMCRENFDEDWIQCYICKDVCVVKKKFVKW